MKTTTRKSYTRKAKNGKKQQTTKASIKGVASARHRTSKEKAFRICKDDNENEILGEICWIDLTEKKTTKRKSFIRRAKNVKKHRTTKASIKACNKGVASARLGTLKNKACKSWKDKDLKSFCGLTDAQEKELLRMASVQSVSLDIRSKSYIVRYYDNISKTEKQEIIELCAGLGHKFILKKLKPNEDVSVFASDSLLDYGIHSTLCGTVGGYVKSNNSNRWFAATNKHVFPTNKKGDPAYGKFGQNDRLNEIGKIEHHINAKEAIINGTQYTYDIALVKIHEKLFPKGHCQCTLLFFENKRELERQLLHLGGASVYKNDRMGTSIGSIDELYSGTQKFSVGGIEEEIHIFHSLKITSANAGEAFMKPGDSGSLVYLKENEQRGIMAMCYIYQDEGKSCLAFPFGNALNALSNKYEAPDTRFQMHCGGRICGNNNARP